MRTKHFLPLVLVLVVLCIAATVNSLLINPTQLGYNTATGSLYLKNGVQTTNGVVTTGTNYGSAGRTNWTWMDAAGWHNTNSVAANQGVDIAKGVVTIRGTNSGPSLIVNDTFDFLVNTNGFIGVNTNRTGALVSINAKTNTGGGQLKISSAFTNVDSQFTGANDLNHVLSFFIRGSGAAGTFITTLPDVVGLSSSGTNGLVFANSSTDANAKIRFAVGGVAVANEAMEISATGLVGINTTTPQERLDVQGNATIRTNAYVGGVTTSTNGFGSLATDARANIGATGYTNNFGKTVVVYLDGTAVTFSVKNSAGTSVYTNAVSLTGEATVILQPGGAVITSGTGVTGTATPF